jgi:hypothetical protein
MRLSGFAAVLAVVSLVFVAQADINSAHAQAACSSLRAEYNKKARPGFLRIVKRNRDVAAYFRNELRRAKSGERPTRAEMRKAYAKTRGACRNGACQRGAKAVYAATLRLYTFNRRWKNAGCPGYLSS